LPKEQRVVSIYQANGELEARVIQSLLESYGIASFLVSHASGSVHPFTIDGLGKVDVVVAEEVAQEATRIIRNKEN
jgi:hypothetical protein